MVAYLPAFAAIRSLASVSTSGACAALELEQWVGDGTSLRMTAASLCLKFCNLGLLVGSYCQASSGSCVFVLPSEENCRLYWLVLACLVLQASLVCEERWDTYFALHVEGPAVAATYEVAGSSLAVADEEKCLAVKSMVNCCCSTHLNGIEKCP